MSNFNIHVCFCIVRILRSGVTLVLVSGDFFFLKARGNTTKYDTVEDDLMERASENNLDG
jgi:hypothetical protein